MKLEPIVHNVEFRDAHGRPSHLNFRNRRVDVILWEDGNLQSVGYGGGRWPIEADVDAQYVVRHPVNDDRDPGTAQWHTADRVQDPYVQHGVINFGAFQNPRALVTRKAVTPLVSCVCHAEALAVAHKGRDFKNSPVDGPL